MVMYVRAPAPAVPTPVGATSTVQISERERMEDIMTNATATKAPATATPAAVISAATAASERLSHTLDAAKGAGNAVIVSAYGADIDMAAVRLAKRAADELAGSAKSRGGARADVLAVVAYAVKAKAYGELVFVAGARVRLDANAAAAKARLDTKRALAAKVNDNTATLDERAAALGVLVGMDDADAAAKHLAAGKSLSDAIDRAKAAGVTRDSMLAMIEDAFEVIAD